MWVYRLWKMAHFCLSCISVRDLLLHLTWLYNISIHKVYWALKTAFKIRCFTVCQTQRQVTPYGRCRFSLRPYLWLFHHTPTGLRSMAFSWPGTILACTHCPALLYTYIIVPVSEMCIIPTFLVTRPIHISKPGLWQSPFVRGDPAIRWAGILKEQLSGAVMHCWFVGLMLGSAWDMLFISL